MAQGYPDGERSPLGSYSNQALPRTTVDDFLRGNAESSSLIVPLFDGHAADSPDPCGFVSVDHPETGSDNITGMKKFTTYEVRGTVNSTPFSSRKRYSDFVWFRQALVLQLPGVFLPALPGKQSVGRFDNAFIEERCARLQQFVLRIFHRHEICIDLPLVMRFLTCAQQDFERMKMVVDHLCHQDMLQDYQKVFRKTLQKNIAPRSDKGFRMVKEFLDKHTPYLHVAHSATAALLNDQAILAARQTDVGRALEEMCNHETEFYQNAQSSATDLRRSLLIKFHKSTQIEGRGKAIHTLNASLQREIEDCDSAQECLHSIELLQQALLATKSKILQECNSLADLKGEARPSDELGNAAPNVDALAQGMRKRDKTKDFFGKVTSGFLDLSAKAGLGLEKRIQNIESCIEEETYKVEVLEALIDAARTVFSATEITTFLETKVAGCLWAQQDFAEKKFAMCQELAECWSQP